MTGPEPYLPALQRLMRINNVDYQDEGTQDYLRALSGPLDDTTGRAYNVALARLVKYAPEDALLLLGAERNLIRYQGEHLAAYRNRILNAFEFWAKAGTLPGMTAALQILGYGSQVAQLFDIDTELYGGYGLVEQTPLTFTLRGVDGSVTDGAVTVTVDGQAFSLPTFTASSDYTYRAAPLARIYEHFHDSQDIWGEFSIYLPPGRAEWTSDPWDDGSAWDDGSTWDINFTADELARVLEVVNLIKPAHARLRSLYLVRSLAVDTWDDGGMWDDETVWEADPPTLLYRRPDA